YQAPWHYLWYSIVAILYGAVLVFFVGFMGSLMVYLGKWGVTQTPFIDATNRDPSYLFVYAPQSFNWRTLLLEGAKVKDGPLVVQHGAIDPAAYNLYTQPWDDTAKRGMHWWNYVGAWLVTVWLGLIFLLVVGFGYSYFWSASTIIYLLMRRRVDDTELDEVYLEEDEGEEMPRAPVTPTPATATTGGNVPLTMVEPPTLKTPPPPPPSPPPAPAVVASPKVESLPPAGGDGNPPA
ncbi:MAG: hypothetical protein JO112_22255, partial [Planctomycetes bacterium]|nr:hypothetical protein [Planctomycetota bacterium]